jgi:hypothetical protein
MNVIVENGRKNKEGLRQYVSDSNSVSSTPLNHKVKSIESAGKADVYDLTIDCFHNFGISAGVFVHNCEMLADPDVDLTVFVMPSSDKGTLYAHEVADAVESDQFGYDINGTTVTDFVYPSWFESFRTRGSTQFDYRNHVQKPFQILPGGYIGVFDVIPSSKGWYTITGEGMEVRKPEEIMITIMEEGKKTTTRS